MGNACRFKATNERDDRLIWFRLNHPNLHCFLSIYKS